jgi:hypothetical protein
MARLAFLLAILATACTATLAIGGPSIQPHGRLVEEFGVGGGAATTPTPTPRATRARAATSPPSAAASHQQHENPLEGVRFDLAAASLSRRSRPATENGVVGSSLSALRLTINATTSSDNDKTQQQTIHALPSTRAAEALKVSWSGLQDPRPDDLIAVLLLQEQEGQGEGAGAASLAGAAPAKFSLLGSAPATNGSLELRLTNYLSPYVAIGLFRGGPSAPRLADGASLVVLRNAAPPRAPVHRRLALAPSDNNTVALSVRWTTRSPNGSPGVWWTDEPPPGSKSRAYKRFAPALPGPALSYSRNEMCGGDAREVGYASPGYFHTAVMSGLVPGRTYWYVVGDAGDNDSSSGKAPPPPPPPEDSVRSPEASFVAPPSGSSSSSSSSRVRVLVTADMGQAEPDGWSQTPDYTRSASVRTARALAAEVERATTATTTSSSSPPPFSLLLHAGDVSYARGYVSLWAAFHDLVEPVASRLPYMLAPGNHEIDWPAALGGNDRFSAETGEAGPRSKPPVPQGGEAAEKWRAARGGKPARDAFDSGGECGVAYARRFAMPTAGVVLSSSSSSSSSFSSSSVDSNNADENKPWYAFDHGPNLRFVVFSTEHDFMPGSEQRAFLERALAGARAGGGDGQQQQEKRPWLILVGHRPLHVCSSWDGFADSDGAVSRALRASLDPLLARYGVDLTISGHHHSFGRTCAVLPSSSGGDSEELGPTCAPEEEEEKRGVVHLVAGNGGAPVSLNPSFPPSPIWRRLRYDWGYLRLDVTAERLVVEAVESAQGEVVDRFELTRRRR